MLRHLSIRNIVLIEKLDLELEAGLTVFTGETGAGKSILLDSLGLAMGQGRRPPPLAGSPAEVSALFDTSADHPAARIAAEHSLDDDSGTLILRRFFADSRRGARLNDRPVGMTLLREIGAHLVQIEGQFASLSLLDPGCHRSIIDAFAGPRGQELARSWREWQGQIREWRRLLSRRSDNRDVDEAERDLCARIAALNPESGEEERLIEERRRMRERAKTLEVLRRILRDLEGDEEGKGVRDRMSGVIRDGAKIIEDLPSEERAVLPSLEDARDKIDAGAERWRSLLRDWAHRHGDLDRIEERLFALKELSRRCRVPVAELAAWRAEKEKARQEIADLDRLGAKAEKRVEECRGRFIDHADRQYRHRLEAAERFERAVHAELPELRLEKARFATRVEKAAEKDWGEHGMDRVHFELAANPGSPAAPLHRSASGGERARIMLALRCVLAGKRPFSTLVFDEIDHGIGGAAAAAVGRRLRNLARHGQVLCITHSPQVAGMAHHHFRVSKHSQGSRTVVRVERLDARGRREEVSRLLAGATITDQARRAADQLIFSNEDRGEHGQEGIASEG